MKIRLAKERGEWAELCFMAKATENGFKLTKPWGDSSPYDFVIDLGGRFVSVQVKSTACQWPCERRSRPGNFVIKLQRGDARRYRQSDFDYLAVYIIPKDAWYIIPFVLVAAQITVRFCPGARDNRYERYREAWQLFREFPLTSAEKAALVHGRRRRKHGFGKRGKVVTRE